MHTRHLFGALALLALPLAACTTSTGGGTGGTGATTESLCDADPRAQSYAAGMSAATADGALKVSFADASPAPPGKGMNTWTIQVTDAQGKPVSGATVVLTPFMPDHGHGPSTLPQVTPMADAGMYQLSLIDLFMPGIWQNTFTITPASGPAGSVVFTFCVDG